MMRMRRATEHDRDDILACLMARPELAMFPLNNLLHHGMTGGHPHAVTMWITRQGDAIRDVLTLTGSGMVMPYLPSGDLALAARMLEGAEVAGFVGPRDWVRGLESILNLNSPRILDADEPHFLLETRDLVLPDGPGRIVPLADAPADVIRDWMLDYQLTALGTPRAQAAERVRLSYDHYLAQQSHVALMDGAAPLAMTGFNAQVPGMVQIGGVYTPPDLRGLGHARRAVALHLLASGAQRATLFSASEQAARAYRALGFRQIGAWALVLLQTKERVGRHVLDQTRG